MVALVELVAVAGDGGAVVVVAAAVAVIALVEPVVRASFLPENWRVVAPSYDQSRFS